MSSPQYGAAHRARRKQAIARLVPGTPCPVSGPPIYPTPSAAVAVGLPASFGRLHIDHSVPVAMGGANGVTRLLHATIGQIVVARYAAGHCQSVGTLAWPGPAAAQRGDKAAISQ